MINKYSLLFIGILFCIQLCRAQEFNWEWVNAAESPGGSNPFSTAADSEGNVYISTCFYAPSITLGDEIIEHPGYSQAKFLIVKYNTNGTLGWIKSMGQNSFCSVESIVIDNEDRLIITGTYRGAVNFGATTLENNTSENVSTFIAKMDTAGNYIWAKKIIDGGTLNNYTRPYNLSIDNNNNNVILVGSFQTPIIDFGNDIQLNLNGNFNYFLTKLTTNGDALWAKQVIRNPGGVSLTDPKIAIDQLDNIFMAGTLSTGTITFDTFELNNSLSSTNIFFTKYNPEGDVEFALQYGGGDWDIFEDITTDSEGNVYTSGRFHSNEISFGTTTLTNNGYFDIFLVKHNINGTVMWAKSISGLYSEEGSYITTDSDNVYVTGIFDSTDLTFDNTIYPSTIPLGNYSTFIAKFSQSGNFIGADTPLNFNSELLYLTSRNNNIFITGIYTENNSFGGISLDSNHPDKNKMFIAKISEETMTSEQFSNNSFSIYPCPAKNTILVPDIDQADYKIFDITARIVMTGQIINNSIDVSALPSGIYILNLDNTTTKFIKE